LEKEFTATAVEKRVYSNCGWKKSLQQLRLKKSLQQLRLKKEFTATAVEKRASFARPDVRPCNACNGTK